jgi:hypothetical protein
MAGDFWLAVRAECQRLVQEGQLADVALPAAQSPHLSAAQPAPAVGSGPDDTHGIVPDSRGEDLARNTPGESARTRAKELRAEHPLLVTTAKALGIRTEAGSFAMGAKGEREVGRKLNQWAARNGWHVLHAVPVGQAGADIDHVVIASFGVVTVNTKTTKTSVWVGEQGMTLGGKSVDYLRKSRAEARRAGQLLGRATGIAVPVQAVIVFTNTKRFSMRRGGPPDIAVLAAPRALRSWLQKQPSVLGSEQVEVIYQAARNPATWQNQRNQPS